MAKVVAPLGSFSASGKIGKAIVFFGHLGRNVVRGLVTPRNAMTESQGQSRLLLGALGRATRAVALLSAYLFDLKQVTPAGQTWVSYFVRRIVDFYGSGATGVTALLAAASGHTKAARFTAEAATLGLSTVDVPYAGTTHTIPSGAQLYALAVQAMQVKASNPSLFDRAPYTTALASWDTSDIADFAEDISTAM